MRPCRFPKCKEQFVRKLGGVRYYCDLHSLQLGPYLKHFGSGRDMVRMRVRIRDDFCCQHKGCTVRRTPQEVAEYNRGRTTLAGRIKNLDVHHRHGLCGKNSTGYDAVADMPNLITLCHKHHYQRHDFSTSGKKAMRQHQHA